MNVRKHLVALGVALCVALPSLAQDKPKVVKVQVDNSTEYVYLMSKCKLMLKQTGTTLSIGGINFGTGPIKSTGTISVDSKLLQSMSAQAQILDQYQFSSCKDLNQIPVNDAKRSSFVAVHGLCVYMLSQLAYFAQMYGPSATTPNTTKPTATKPNTTKKPTETKPNTPKSNTTEPSAAEPNTTEPNTTEPNKTEPNTTALNDALLKWIVQSGDLLDKIWSKQLLSADSERAAQKKIVEGNLSYALTQLNISPGTGPMQDALQDPLKRIVQQ